MLIEVIILTIIVLLYPIGFLAGYARGRRVKVLTAISQYVRGEGDDGPGDTENA